METLDQMLGLPTCPERGGRTNQEAKVGFFYPNLREEKEEQES